MQSKNVSHNFHYKLLTVSHLQLAANLKQTIQIFFNYNKLVATLFIKKLNKFLKHNRDLKTNTHTFFKIHIIFVCKIFEIQEEYYSKAFEKKNIPLTKFDP